MVRYVAHHRHRQKRIFYRTMSNLRFDRIQDITVDVPGLFGYLFKLWRHPRPDAPRRIVWIFLPFTFKIQSSQGSHFQPTYTVGINLYSRAVIGILTGSAANGNLGIMQLDQFIDNGSIKARSNPRSAARRFCAIKWLENMRQVFGIDADAISLTVKITLRYSLS